jgi:hypothetical protein
MDRKKIAHAKEIQAAEEKWGAPQDEPLNPGEVLKHALQQQNVSISQAAQQIGADASRLAPPLRGQAGARAVGLCADGGTD